jgi:hypothetical protein
MTRCTHPATTAATLLLVALSPFALGLVGPVGDAALFHLPYQMLVGDFARAGEFLLWNPWTNGGSPDGAEPQIGAYSPIAVLAGLIGGGSSLSFALLWLATWSLSAAGFARLATQLGAPGWASLVLALAWSTNGAFVGHAGHTCFVHAFAFLPWMVFELERALAARGRASLVHAAACGGAWGLSALAGYPGLVVVCGLFLGGWALVRVLASDGERRAHWPAALRALVVATATALVVLAPSYAAFFVEGAEFSGRTNALPRDIATGWRTQDPVEANALEPRALWTFANPLVAALAADPARDPFASTDPTSVGLDVGLCVACLALAALGGRARRREVRALLVLGLLFLALALGGTLPLRAWLYDLVPPTRLFRHASFFRVGFLFALAALAAHGAATLEPRRVARAALAIGVASALGTLGAFASLDLWPATVATTALAVLAPLAAGLLVWGAARRGDAGPTSRAFLAVGLVAATSAPWIGGPLVAAPDTRVQSLDASHRADLEPGASGFERRLFAPTIDPAAEAALLRGDTASVAAELADPVGRLFDSANLPPKLAVLAGYTALNNALHHALVAHPVLLVQCVGAERVFFAREALHLPGDAATFEAWAGVAAGGAVPLVVHDGGPAPLDLAAAVERARLAPLPCTVVRYEPRALELELDAPAPEAGWLYVTERFAAGWSARVDGAVADVVRAGFLWRAVALPAGARRVEFTYQPFGHPWLVLLSWSTLAAVALALFLSGRARASERHAAPVC